MTFHVIENADSAKSKCEIREGFMHKICSQCSNRYGCITHGYKMHVTEKDKFVLIEKNKRQKQVECYYYQRRSEDNNSQE